MNGTMIKRKATGVLADILANRDAGSLARTRNRMFLAIRIANGIQAKGWTQKQFALEMGKTESEVSEWLSGNRNFTVDTMTDIERCLGIRLLDTSVIEVHNVSSSPISIKVSRNTMTKEYSASSWDIQSLFNDKPVLTEAS